MTRSKVNSTPVLNSFDDIDRALRRIGQINSHVAAIEAGMKKSIDKIKEEAVRQTQAELEEKKQLEKNVEDFTSFNRNQFYGKKSMNLNFGVIGYRKSSKLVTIRGWTWARVVDKLEELKLVQFLKIKKSVDKEAVKNSGYTDMQLKDVGMKIDEQDEFFYEIDEAKVAEMPRMNILSKTG